jgi:hypothetical protein
MTVRTARGRLAGLWAGCFAVALLAALYLHWWIGISSDTFKDTMEMVSGQYAPFLGAVLGFYLSSKKKEELVLDGDGAFYLAVLMSALWNMVILGGLGRVGLNLTTIEESNKDILSVLPKLSWIVAPAIGYFFGKPEKKE